MKKHLVVLIALLVALLAVAAVSSAEGIEIADGDVIQYGELDSVTKIDGHSVVYRDENFKKPTCTEYGMVKFYCDQVHDGETTSSHVVYIAPLGHVWSSESGDLNWGKVVKEAKCNEPGLAVDYCLVCHTENPDVTRTILTDHVYNDKHYQVVYPATCTEYGWAVHTCIYCDMVNPDDAKAWAEVVEKGLYSDLLAGKYNLIKLPYVDHAWTKWTIKESTCNAYGEAKRACEVCGATQELNKYQTKVLDHGKEITIDEIIPLKNAKWDEEVAVLNGVKFNSQNALDEALAKIKNCKYEVTRNWLADCYTREITLSCPYCHGTVHPDVTYKMIYPLTAAHEWVLSEVQPEGESIAPTCTEEGKDVYLCIHDNDMAPIYGVTAFHGHPVTMDEENKFIDPAKLEIVVPALGHDWSEWKVADTYVNEAGETVVREARSCQREGCHATENRVVKAGEEVLDNGLVKQADGSWKYFVDGEFQDEYTGFVSFQGGEFWVTNGVVDSKLNGLINCPGDKWLFFAQGQVQRVTQWAEYAGEWFIIVNGELKADATGLYDYNGGTFAVAVGRKLNVNGLWQDPVSGKWVFLANGQLQKVTQEVTYDGATFNVVDGYLAE